MGTIVLRRQNQSIKFQAKIRIKHFPSLSRTFLTRPEAERWIELHETEIRARIDTTKIEAERQRIATKCAPEHRTLGDLLRRYRAVVTPHKRSAVQETLRLTGLLKHSLADCPLGSLAAVRVAEWRDLRLQTVSSSTVRRDMVLLAHVLEIAADEWGESFSTNPFRVVRRPKESAPRDRRLRAGEESALLAACDDARAVYLRPVVELALETAMRQAEIVGLDWANISLTGRAAHLPMTKNGTSRGVPLSSRAVKILEKLPVKRNSAGDRVGPVFPGVTTEAIKRAFIRARNRAKLDDFRFHDLRHEATSRFFERKLTVPEVARITGHKTWTMLERYTHLHLGDVARRLDQPKDAATDARTIERLSDELRRLIERMTRHSPKPPPF